VNFLPLTESDYREVFAPRGIGKELADRTEIRRVISLDGAALVGVEGRPGDYSGLAIPNIRPGARQPRAYRLRRDHPDVEMKNGESRTVRRYLSAPGSCNLAYFMPGTTVDDLGDVERPVIFTEGELKSIALSALAHYLTARARFLAVGLNGIYGWKGTVARDSDENGARHAIKGVLTDIENIAMRGRLAYIAYDTDLKSETMANVRRARTLLAKELLDRGAADVRFVEIPIEACCKGIDDVIGAWGPHRVLEELIGRARSATADRKSPPAYFAREGCLWQKTHDMHGVETDTRLSNFVVQVVENRLIDNGVEEEAQLVYRMRGSVKGSPPREFDLAHSRFKEPDWPEHVFGTKDAYTEVKQVENVRRAIAEISLGAPKRVAYRHLGHREIEGKRSYLHGPGAIGIDGVVSGVETSLPKELSRYELRLPANASEGQEAIRASLRTIDCARREVTYPLLGTACRAPLGPTAHVGFLMGPSGALKTGVAAVFLQHFGALMGWNGLNYSMPLSFASTANSIAENLFLVKDSLVVVDDFAPHSEPNEMARRRNILERIVRDVGNQAGRGRLGLKLGGGVEGRPVHPPRGTVVVTGEDIVHGESLLARMLVIPVDPDAVNLENLTQSQSDGMRGLLSTAMGAYIQWLLADFNARLEAFRERVDALRSRFIARHRRTPGAVAELAAALELFLAFALEAGAIQERSRDQLMAEAEQALIEVAQSQLGSAAAGNPALRFRGLIRTLIATRRAHILDCKGLEPPAKAEMLGWFKSSGTWTNNGSAIGWADGDDLYLDPVGAYAAAQRLATEQREPLVVTEQTLRKRLAEAKLTITDSKRQRTTVRRTILGRSIQVLHVVRDFLGKSEDQEEDEDEE
jgi:hypothetical protein